MRLVIAFFSLALLSSVALAGNDSRRIYLQGTGNITHADGSSDKYLVSMLIKKQDDNSKIIYCRYLGFDFDYMNKMRIVKHDNGTLSVYKLSQGTHAHSDNQKVGHGFYYKDDAFHMIMHMHSAKGAVEVHFETEPGNPSNVIVRGMATKDHTMVHLWENKLKTIYHD